MTAYEGADFEESLGNIAHLERIRTGVNEKLRSEYLKHSELYQFAQAAARDYADETVGAMADGAAVQPSAIKTLEDAYTKIAFTFTEREDFSQTPGAREYLDLIADWISNQEGRLSVELLAGFLDLHASHLWLVRELLEREGELRGLTRPQQFFVAKLRLENMVNPEAEDRGY